MIPPYWISWHSVLDKNLLHVILRHLIHLTWQVIPLVLSRIDLTFSLSYHWSPRISGDVPTPALCYHARLKQAVRKTCATNG